MRGRALPGHRDGHQSRSADRGGWEPRRGRFERLRRALVRQLRADPGLFTDRAGSGQLSGAARRPEREDRVRKGPAVSGARRSAHDPACNGKPMRSRRRFHVCLDLARTKPHRTAHTQRVSVRTSKRS